MRRASVEGPGFEFRCCLLTTGPQCHRCALTCLQTESKTGAVNGGLALKAPIFLSLRTETAFIDIVYDSITQTDFVIFSLKMMNHMDLQKGVSYMPTIIAVEELGLQSQDLTVCTTVF